MRRIISDGRARLLAVDTLFEAASWADVVRESQEIVELALTGFLRACGVEPPAELKRIMELIDTARSTGPEGQVKAAQEIFRIWADNVFEIGTIGLTPMVQGVVVANTKLRNIPATLGNDWPLRTPGNARTEQFFFTR